MSQIIKVNAEGIHVKHGSTIVVVPLPQPLPDGATNVEWDAEMLSLNYVVPVEVEGEEPTHESRQLTQADLDAAIEWRYTPSLEELKDQKKEAIKQARDAEWMDTLMTSFDIPFKTDVQTQIDLQMLIQRLDQEEVLNGYKCADGIRRDISREQFQLALKEGVDRKITAFAKEGQLLEQLEYVTTVEEINYINW